MKNSDRKRLFDNFNVAIYNDDTDADRFGCERSIEEISSHVWRCLQNKVHEELNVIKSKKSKKQFEVFSAKTITIIL